MTEIEKKQKERYLKHTPELNRKSKRYQQLNETFNLVHFYSFKLFRILAVKYEKHEIEKILFCT